MPDAPRSSDGAAVAVGDGANGNAPSSRTTSVAQGDGAFKDELVAQRNTPVGGQAVLEGVMMRGISTWAVAVRKPLPEQLKGDGFDPEEGARGEIEVTSFPL